MQDSHPPQQAEAVDATALRSETLTMLPEDVSTPGYDRRALTPGVLHVGVGNFHRAHQANYFHRLFELGEDFDWAIIGAGMMHFDEAMRDKLGPQDWLTTIVELDPKGYRASVIGSMIDFVAVDPVALIDAMQDPQIRIVSLTVTEGGYFLSAETGGFDPTHPAIVRETGAGHPPQTVFGVIIAALKARRARGHPPFTIMSCDNLPENGHVARATVLGLARLVDPDLADWIADNVAFPNSMVDCITPATGAREIDLVRARFGIEDAAPVVCEPFRQWVMEDNFPQGRPALEKVGVEFVRDVAPYELMKLRILNGGHAAIAYSSALLGHHFVHDAMADPLIAGFLSKLTVEEILPTVPEIEGVSLTDYVTVVASRFSNSALGDTIPRLCLDGSNRQPKFILPTIADRLAAGQPVNGLALEVALWAHYCAAAHDGAAVAVDDPNAARLTERALAARKDPREFLAMPDIFGAIAQSPDFVCAFAKALERLQRTSTREVLAGYLAN
ncbi:MAG: mannitol dehydrogenase family protein [Hoeflea sp.]|uniref:mannitol dehydrogenase family protein n=1 Tax=Hoeflea sp. TaxID=1940281 RepID=UPI001D356A07|nr:mannitol dehydrogenase family protein [Hoeflea sp.]MBU4528131.1 mannitol dehydrogenase family protein [Alphaproteobacteria bacterium]MBU4543727.1 mannitol dehydrogenase family protein [Alphaproteobacteria bacterium]MBU4548594.1 mannitol dehydrogenase family protein [Alphaproteobacteria bacterium]MBV1725760.1 mannitol dehydrogenase family protein [Hoeflea sp.]MBV1762116.1 mannitol dehydrogenase family protein [Hoeflea sp.]